MPAHLDVAFLPITLDSEALRGRAVVVVDILRATTTIVNALNNGAERIIPSPSVEGARKLHRDLGPESILGGERGGLKVDGFQCGNSPTEYSPDTVKDRTLILATTNGTIAMEACRQADEILIGAFVNLSRVANRLAEQNKMTILCAGTRGAITGEDILFAGALAEELRSQIHDLELTDAARIAWGHWQMTQQIMSREDKSLAHCLRKTRGGRNMIRIGQDADIEFCAQVDSLPVLPRLNAAKWHIRLD